MAWYSAWSLPTLICWPCLRGAAGVHDEALARTLVSSVTRRRIRALLRPNIAWQARASPRRPRRMPRRPPSKDRPPTSRRRAASARPRNLRSDRLTPVLPSVGPAHPSRGLRRSCILVVFQRIYRSRSLPTACEGGADVASVRSDDAVPAPAPRGAYARHPGAGHGACAGAAGGPARAPSREPVLVFAAASLKNALDDIAAQYERETGERSPSPTGQPGPGEADRGRGARRPLHLGGPGLDGLPPGPEPDQAGHARQHARQPPRPRRAEGQSRRRSRSAPASRWPSCSATDASPWPTRSRSRPGKYGRAALESLGVWQAVEPRVAAAENVRAALALVSRGEAPLGIVYQTDAAADPNVKIVGMFPEDTHPPIIYPGGADRRLDATGRARLPRVHASARRTAGLGKARLHGSRSSIRADGCGTRAPCSTWRRSLPTRSRRSG